MIIFEKIDDLHLLKSAYKNYENIINDLEFDGQNILIKNDKSDLVYVRENLILIFLFQKTKVISKNKLPGNGQTSEDFYSAGTQPLFS